MARVAYVGYLFFACGFLSILGCIPRSFDDLIVQPNFDVNRFVGVWFEIKWLPAEPHKPSDIWRNFYQKYQLNSSNQNQLLAYGEARGLNNDTCFPIGQWSFLVNNSAKMILQSKDGKTPLNWPFYVISTDYDHYSLIYACTDNNYSSNQRCNISTFWLFSRTTSLSSNLTTDLDDNMLKQLCINQNSSVEITPHDGKQCYSSSSSNTLYSNFILSIFLFFLYV